MGESVMNERAGRQRYVRQSYITRNGIRRGAGRVPPGRLRSGAVLLSPPRLGDPDHPAMVAWRVAHGVTRSAHVSMLGARRSSVGVRTGQPGAVTVAPADAADAAAPDAGAGRKMFGYFARFNEWTEVDSVFEGRFLERNTKGAFRSTLADPGRIRVLFQHGADPQAGSKPLGPFSAREDSIGAYYEGDLLDVDYVQQLVPAARAGLLGASYRFAVPSGGDLWAKPSRITAHNPDRLPERTVLRADLFEFGPVTFPAYPNTTAHVA
jgi:phage head maturation protease